jgi:glycosyltransferase involved in cell wall biosynthesis
LLQGYPNLEYIVVDGGSTDGSVEVLQKYEPWLADWVSEPDRGQTHAINKGLEQASGAVRGYLNSDDLLLPDALYHVGQAAARYGPDSRVMLMGACQMGTDEGQGVDQIWRPALPETVDDVLDAVGLCPQPATFWTAPESGPDLRFDESKQFAMDHAFWAQLMTSGYTAKRIPHELAYYRKHEDAKGETMTDVMWLEGAIIALDYLRNADPDAETVDRIQYSRRKLHHFMRIRVRQARQRDGRGSALSLLFKFVAEDPAFLFQRPTLGMLRRLLVGAS